MFYSGCSITGTGESSVTSERSVSKRSEDSVGSSLHLSLKFLFRDFSVLSVSRRDLFSAACGPECLRCTRRLRRQRKVEAKTLKLHAADPHYVQKPNELWELEECSHVV